MNSLKFQIVSGSVFVLLVGGLLVASTHADESEATTELTDSEFQRLHKLLRPAPDEAWRTIPWKIALLDAQRQATEEQKPIFIWAMDGHPLGCT